MIDPTVWLADLLPQLQKTFGSRLRYLGLQGSYRRGEASESSDIDLVVLLDVVELPDLDAYRGLVHAMPEGEKACGFISGLDELFHWPHHELFSFKMDTVDIYGKLDEFLPTLGRADIAASVNIGASGLVHLLTHTYLYAESEAKPAILKEAYKSAFFVMLMAHFLATGEYCRSKAELLTRLHGAEAEIILASQNFLQWLSAHSEHEAYALLLDWSKKGLKASA